MRGNFMKKNGIYGYWDTQKECVVYIGKDSNISVNRRHKDHHAPSRYDEQRINRILQNNEGRYTYLSYAMDILQKKN